MHLCATTETFKCLRRTYISTAMVVFVSHYSMGFMPNKCFSSFLGVLLVRRKTAFPEGRMQLPGRFGWWGVCSCLCQKAVICWISGPTFFFGGGGGDGRESGGGGHMKLGERNKTYF